MATTESEQASQPIRERLATFLRRYYREELTEVAVAFPQDQASVHIDFSDIYQFDMDIADDVRSNPRQLINYFEETLSIVDLPVDVDLGSANVRIKNLPETATYYPGQYSPSELRGKFVAIEGECVQATDTYAMFETAAFECQRCASTTNVPQHGDRFSEPHECQGCERQGPFKVDFAASELLDAQDLRIQEPPEVAGGAARSIDVHVEDDLTDTVSVGDRVTITGTFDIKQPDTSGSTSVELDEYLIGNAIELDETDHETLELTAEEKDHIQALARGEEGTPLTLAAASLAPKIVGYDHIKRAAILQIVGGHRVINPDGSAERGDIHMLLLGDPGTTKSKLVEQVESKAPRSVGVSGKGAREAGITASAVRDDFGDAEWALKAGAFVKANGGIVCIDELDDMDESVRASMLEPMSRQSIHVNKAGINATLTTRVAVLAAGNPKYGRWDEYTPLQEQFDLESALISRFDLIFTLRDKPDPDEDEEIADHISKMREVSKRLEVAPKSVSESDKNEVEPPVEADILTKWIALAKRQSAPVFENDAVRERMKESFVDLRGANGYDTDDPVPVTFRKFEATLRLAEAAAKFELSDTIEERHADMAMNIVGQSMQDYGKNEDGDLDADVQEVGTPSTQQERMKTIEAALQHLQAESDSGAVNYEDLYDHLHEECDIPRSRAESDIDKIVNRKGWAIEPDMGQTIRWVGR